jgi:hypothetical protein
MAITGTSKFNFHTLFTLIPLVEGGNEIGGLESQAKWYIKSYSLLLSFFCKKVLAVHRKLNVKTTTIIRLKPVIFS